MQRLQCISSKRRVIIRIIVQINAPKVQPNSCVSSNLHCNYWFGVYNVSFFFYYCIYLFHNTFLLSFDNNFVLLDYWYALYTTLYSTLLVYLYSATTYIPIIHTSLKTIIFIGECAIQLCEINYILLN